MNNNQYYGGQNPQQPMYNGYPQQTMNTNFMQQNIGYQQPMNNQLMYGHPVQKKSRGALIVLLCLIVIIAICTIVPYSENSTAIKRSKGEWECKNPDGSIVIKLNVPNDDKLSFTVTQNGYTVYADAKYKNGISTSGKSLKKKGYKYTLFKLSDGRVSDGKNEAQLQTNNKGFLLGINSKNEGHYITGDGKQSGSLQYECKKIS